MTEQTETTEIKMNMRNINVITALSVPVKPCQMIYACCSQ
ncbi:hypothetical protein ECDEC11B_5379 [Escherichia coli DEC11B]|nr:hypothetical protein ECDEC11B_5379 [Escherichia coli DEC11B]